MSKHLWGVFPLLVTLAATAPAFAQGFSVDWYSVDGGGGRSTGAGFTVAGTIGQPDAGDLSGGDYLVRGGFWTGTSGTVVDAAETVSGAPRAFRVHRASPNPFNPSTSVRFELPAPEHVTLRLFDLQGKLVTVLADGLVPAGLHTVRWDGRRRDGTPVSSGVYLLEVRAGGASSRQKLVLLE